MLFSYSGDNCKKLSDLYPNEKVLKVWKLRLFCNKCPDISDGWEEQKVRGRKSGCKTTDRIVYLYNKLALYLFGGEVYLLTSEGHLIKDSSQNPSSSYLPLTTSNKPQKRTKTQKTTKR